MIERLGGYQLVEDFYVLMKIYDSIVRTFYLNYSVCKVQLVCRVNRGKVKLDALLPEGHTRAWQCKDVPLICQRLHVDLLDTGYPVG